MKILKFIFFILFVIAVASCKKEFSLENANFFVPAGTWQFQEGVNQYAGNVDSSFIGDEAGGSKSLTITGKSLSGGENFLITLYTADSFAVGSYSASISEAVFDYSIPTKTIFLGDFLSGDFVVNITSLSNNSITGTFSGEVTDSTGNLRQITLGEFTSTINLSNNHINLAEGTLGSVADSCTPITLSGTFEQGMTLSTSNTLEVEVNITKPGVYNITTNSVNGIRFFSDGKFTNTGVQTVILQGDGTPVTGGIQTFTITFGNSHCTFSVDFLFDYFPTTVNSNWAFGLEGGTSADSALLNVADYSPTFGGNFYSTFTADDIPPSGFPDTFYFRKSEGDYFEYFDASNYFLFDAPVFAEFIFLTENEPVGSVIFSPIFNGTYSGIPASGHIEVTIIEKGVPATVGTRNFSDVIKVTYDFYSSVIPNTSLITVERWYARGVGLVYQNDSVDILNVGRYTVF
jgi:hypothetical protein